MIHDFAAVVERVGESLRIRPVTMPEAGIVSRDQVKAIGQPRKEGSNIRDVNGGPCNNIIVGAS
jgi:hypothetical protein